MKGLFMTHPSSTAATTIDRICRVEPPIVLARRYELKCTERELRRLEPSLEPKAHLSVSA
ncbi:hypothetical protein [Polaromonas sp. YR568]|uniref:hypothetical protein n=1 Tax=Polaromonas sp. YR568 TaxID=1855301 RepID=UPI003137EFBF